MIRLVRKSSQKSEVAHKEWMASLPKYATWISSNAKYFNHEAKDQAMAMRQSGRTPEEVYAKTGMYYGEGWCVDVENLR